MTNKRNIPLPTTPAHHPLPPPKEGNRRGIKGELCLSFFACLMPSLGAYNEEVVNTHIIRLFG